MFTGIVEATGTVFQTSREGSNLILHVRSPISNALAIDQSLSHNGVCLTVTSVRGDVHEVAIVEETLLKSNLGTLQIGDEVNLERAMRVGDRLDGHLVQGHVDARLVCSSVENRDGSHLLTFGYETAHAKWLIPKGSICLNGISLTIANLDTDSFTVAIIPYTWQHTNLRHCVPGSEVNVEFDMVGKYLARFHDLQRENS